MHADLLERFHVICLQMHVCKQTETKAGHLFFNSIRSIAPSGEGKAVLTEPIPPPPSPPTPQKIGGDTHSSKIVRAGEGRH